MQNARCSAPLGGAQGAVQLSISCCGMQPGSTAVRWGKNVKKHHCSLNWAPALLLALPFAVPVQAASMDAKQLAGDPTEFAAMARANPIESAIHSKSALLPVTLEKRADGRFGWQGQIPVESQSMRFLVFSGEQNWAVNVADPISKRMRPIESLATTKTRGSFGIAERGAVANSYSVDGISAGEWTMSIESKQGGRGYLLLEGLSEDRLMAHQVAMNQKLGQRIALVASVYSLDPSALSGNTASVQEAWLQVTSPDGKASRVAMFDDGLHQDGIAGDGTFGADFLADAAGNFNAQVMIKATNANGQSFLRTSEHLIPVIDDSLALRGSLTKAVQSSSNRLSIALPVTTSKAKSHYRTFAQVWGTRAGTKEMVPVSWIGGMTEVKRGTLELGLDTRWIARAGVQAPFELRDIRIEDPDYFITVTDAKRLSVDMPVLPKSAQSFVSEINDEMRVGPRPASLKTKGTGSKLLLVHGYCSGNVWGPVAGQFSNAAVFQDLKQNRSHDDFALRIKSFGNTWNSYGIVAHSQGGAAALHLYNYYWSGLDNASGSRLIQSVGTPYQGTALAGNAAALGNVFGVGCGTNSNLTYSGASSWLKGISSSSRAKANFYTTSFTDRSWVWDYCNAVTDVLLSDPEDGTTEKSYGQLSGGINRGHVTGWCHTSGMRDPAQTTDSGRNSTMNANAAR